ncbi:unnamed protein product [Cuscuta campestris]|uniref:Uncharacterized protein n=1 Tax=Cuscuta campestris TaxID=132261 RepID=A0A484KTL1_9ASTE|nr:unnamed protein product [Cuscuta campestris]
MLLDQIAVAQVKYGVIRSCAVIILFRRITDFPFHSFLSSDKPDRKPTLFDSSVVIISGHRRHLKSPSSSFFRSRSSCSNAGGICSAGSLTLISIPSIIKECAINLWRLATIWAGKPLLRFKLRERYNWGCTDGPRKDWRFCNSHNASTPTRKASPADPPNSYAFFACVLSLTRELAVQICQQFNALGAGIGAKCVTVSSRLNQMISS